jgi:hypothetical protein
LVLLSSETWPPPDPVGEALHFLRMDGAFYCRSELSAPWGLTLDPMPGYLWFHVVTIGGALLEVDPEHARWLHPGDVSLVPHGNGHVLRSEPGVPAPGILELELEHPSDRYEILRHGGGVPTTLICGAVRFDHPVAHNLVGILPAMLYIQGRASETLSVVPAESDQAAAALEHPDGTAGVDSAPSTTTGPKARESALC